MRRCSECGRDIEGRRDRVTCSARCRVARSRRLERCQERIGTTRLICVAPNGHDGPHQVESR